MTTPIRLLCLAALLSAFHPHAAAAESFHDAVHAYLQRCVAAQGGNVGVVVGIVDEHGSSVISCGKLDNGTDRQVDGDTVFEIGSITKTFTGLLLEDMVERGQMRLDDPVAMYLPATIKVPSRDGRQITLLELATHTSGLPPEPDNLDPKRAEYPCEGYTAEDLFTFLSSYRLTRDPGMQFQYSSAGIAVLAQAIVRKAGMDYESLVIDRICRPLQMDHTRITLTPQLETRFAVQHSPAGFRLPSSYFGPLTPAGGLRSTANDMLKYLSANLGLTPSRLTPLMQRTHEIHFRNIIPNSDIGLVWITARDPKATPIIWHNGALAGCVAFAGFDKAQRRGVVVLSNSRGFLDATGLGKSLLRFEAHSRAASDGTMSDALPPLPDPPRQPAIVTLDRKLLDACVGNYEIAPDPGSNTGGKLTIRREADHLIAQFRAPNATRGAIDVYPESDSQFVLTLDGSRLTFIKNDRKEVTGLVHHCPGVPDHRAKKVQS